MRKSVAVMLAVIAICAAVSVAFGDEVLFADVPWESDMFAFERTMNSMGFNYTSSREGMCYYFDKSLETKDETLGSFMTSKNCGFVLTGTIISSMESIGDIHSEYDGCKISTITIYGHYRLDENGGIIDIKPKAVPYLVMMSALSENPTEAYEELTEKYTRQYGKYDEKWGSSYIYDFSGGDSGACDFVRRTFYGDNGTAVSIVKYILKGYDYRMFYIMIGRTGHDETIQMIDESAGDAGK